MSHRPDTSSIEILLVEDNPGDVHLTREAIKDNNLRVHLTIVPDGEKALSLLRRRCQNPTSSMPDLILLDLNLPCKDGHQVLTEIKADEQLQRIPVVVFTASQDEQDVLKSYRLHANCYVHKPLDLDQFIAVIQYIESFWLTVVKLPPALTS